VNNQQLKVNEDDGSSYCDLTTENMKQKMTFFYHSPFSALLIAINKHINK
jgi:hypothetical protein